MLIRAFIRRAAHVMRFIKSEPRSSHVAVPGVPRQPVMLPQEVAPRGAACTVRSAVPKSARSPARVLADDEGQQPAQRFVMRAPARGYAELR